MENFAQAARHWGYLALAHLGWSVEEFWRATPEEVRMGLAPPHSPQSPLGRAALEALLQQDAAEP